MKRYLKALLNIFIFFFCPIIITKGAEIIVNVDKPPQSRSIVFFLFDSADTFGDFSNYTKKLRFTSDGRKIFRLPDIPPGEYALLVFYDENGNGSLDKNVIGIPQTPSGFLTAIGQKGRQTTPVLLFS